MTTLNPLASVEGQNAIATAIRETGTNIINAGISAQTSATAAATSANSAAESATAAATSATAAASSVTQTETIKNEMLAGYGYPFTAAAAAAMTDPTKIYVYTGNEAGYIAGNWYYHNGTEFVDGGVFNSDDPTTKAEMSLFGIKDVLWENTSPNNNIQNGVTYTVDKKNKNIMISSDGSPSSGPSVLNFLLSSDAFPAWLQRGKTYIMHMETEAPVRFEIWQKRAGEASSSILKKTRSHAEFTLANDAVGVGIRLWMAAEETINAMVRPFISEALTVTELKQEIETSIEDISSLLIFNTGYIDNNNGNVWATGSGIHAVYPVNGGETIKSVGNGSSSSSLAALKTYNYESGVVADFSDDANWDGVKVLSPNKVFEDILPNDARYVYFYYSVGNTIRHQKELYIDGYDIIATLVENIKGITKNINKELCNNILINNGYINQGEWYRTAADYKHMVYPVNGGETVRITAQPTGNASLAALKSYSVPTEGNSVDFSNDENWKTYKVISAGTTEEFTLPEDARFIYNYYGSNEQKRYPQSLLIDDYDIMATIKGNIAKIRKEANAVKVRIMQYNVGRFNYGNTQNEGLPANIYDEKLLELKKLFTSTEPDILCMQEVKEYLDHDQTHLSNDVLFDVLFPFKKDLFSYNRAVKSKYPVSYIGTKTISATIDGETYNSTYAQCTVNVNGKILDVITLHLPSYPNALDYQKRAILFPQLLEALAGAKYGFVILDMNNGGNGSDISAKDEAEELLEVARSYGWEFAHGGFLPFQKTYFDPVRRPDLFSPIDHIVYKDNGNVIFNNFVVCHEDYDVLPSDHDPVYADFIIR